MKFGQFIEWSNVDKNRLIKPPTLKLKRTRLLVKNRDDGKQWNIGYYTVNLDHADIAISNPTGRLDRNSLKIGDKVAFKDSKGHEHFGEVIKLNPKTAGVLVDTTRWKVGYGWLSLIIEGEVGRDMNLIEGEVLDRE